MKRTAIALAVAAFAAAPAMAEVTLSGSLIYEVTMDAGNDDTGVATANDTANAVITASVPLNNGLTGSASFTLNGDLDSDDDHTDVVSESTWSISGDNFGTLSVGDTGNGVAGAAQGHAIDGDLSLSSGDGVRYQNTMGSLSYDASFSGNADADGMTFALGYSAGALKAGFGTGTLSNKAGDDDVFGADGFDGALATGNGTDGYVDITFANEAALATAITNAQDISMTVVGAEYAMGAITVGGAMHIIDITATNAAQSYESTLASFDASYKMSDMLTLSGDFSSVSDASVGGVDTAKDGTTGFGIAAAYTLSDATSLSAYYDSDTGNGDNANTATEIGLGVAHKLSAATSLSFDLAIPDNGNDDSDDDDTTFTAGITHDLGNGWSVAALHESDEGTAEANGDVTGLTTITFTGAF